MTTPSDAVAGEGPIIVSAASLRELEARAEAAESREKALREAAEKVVADADAKRRAFVGMHPGKEHVWRDDLDPLRAALKEQPVTTEELRVIRTAMDRLALTAEDEDDAALVESVIDRAEAAEAKLAAQEEELLAVLREVEWGGQTSLDWEYAKSACPLCGGVDPGEWDPGYDDALSKRDPSIRKGHTPDCRLATLLGPAMKEIR